MMIVLMWLWTAAFGGDSEGMARVKAVRADDSFELPSFGELNTLTDLCADLMRLAPQGQVPTDAAARAQKAGYSLEHSGNLLWLTDARSRGGGVIGIRLGPLDQELILQAPHPFFDLRTGAIVGQMFDEQPIRAVQFASAQRYVEEDSDAAHSPLHPFNAATDGLVRGSAGPLVVQLHGFAERAERTADLYYSGGQSWWQPSALESVETVLRAQLPGPVVAPGGGADALGGTKNVQARLLASRAPVLLLELDPDLRKELAGDDAPNPSRSALGSALQSIASVAQSPALPTPAWSQPQALSSLLAPDGTLPVPAGTALRLQVSPATTLPRLHDRLGHAVEMVGLDDSVLIPAEPWARALEVDVPFNTEVTVWLQSRRGQSVRWDQWERKTYTALRRQLPFPDPVPGAEPLLRELEARREAGLSLGLQALGLLHDTTLHRPVTTSAFGPPESVGEPADGLLSAEVEGPARLQLVAEWAEPGRAQEAVLHWSLDGGDGQKVVVRSVAGTARSQTLFIPPGSHRLEARLEGDPAQLSATRRAVRPSTAWPSVRPTSSTRLEEAERSRLTGQPQQARDQFRALVEASGSEGAFARARLLEGDDELELTPEGIDLTQLPDGAGPATSALHATRVLQRGADLPSDQVAAALALLPDASPAELAPWLDAASVDRPHGSGLWATRYGLVPELRSEGRAYVDHLGTHSSLRSLAPDGVARTTWRASAPGIPRGLLQAGEAGEFQLPEGPLGRVVVLRLQCPEDCRFELRGADGAFHAISGPAGRYDMALEAGRATVSVSDGRLLVLDPELLDSPALVYETTGGLLPARWTLPGDPVPVDLRPEVQAGGSLGRAVFDDGTVREITERGLVAPAGARSVWIQGTGLASLAMRVPKPEALSEATAPISCADASLEQLEEVQRSALHGRPQARAEVARILGCIGLPGMARTQLSAARRAGELPPAELQRLEDWLRTTLPDAPVAGPTQRLSTTGSVGASGTSYAPELAALAEAHPPLSAALWRETALAWEAEAAYRHGGKAESDKALTRALDAALKAGEAGEAVAARLLTQLDWADVAIAERSAGVDTATLSLPPDPGTTHAARARRALWAWPWPADSALRLRNEAAASLTLPPHEQAMLEVACRDDRATSQPCSVVLTRDGEPSSVSIPEGAPVELPLPAGLRSLELHGPGEGHSLSVRLVVDGQVVPPTTERQVLRASPAQPIVVQVRAPAALRLQALDQQPLQLRVTSPDPTQAPVAELLLEPSETPAPAGSPPDLLLPDSEAGSYRIELTGEGRVLLRVGVWRDQWSEDELDELIDDPVSSSTTPPAVTTTVRTLGALPRRPLAWGSLPSAGGTWEFATIAGRDQVWSPSEPWPVVELSLDRLRRVQRRWFQAGGWLHGPNEAAGARVELGYRGSQGWIGGRLTGRAGRDIANAEVSSGGLVVFGVRDRPLSAASTLRLEGRADALLQSEPPVVVADPAVWTVYRDDHPVYLEGGLRLLHDWRRETRLDAVVRARTNTGPSLDRVGAGVGLDHLFGSTTWLSAGVATDLRLADEDRSTTQLNPRLDARLQHAFVATVDHHLRGWTQASWQPVTGGFEAWIGLRYLRSDGRGLRDPAPYRELFRTELEGT